MKFKKNWAQSDENFIKAATSASSRHELLIKLNLQRYNSASSEIMFFVFVIIATILELVWRDTNFQLVLISLIILASNNARKQALDSKIKTLKLFEKCQYNETI